ncbi:MAG: SulP family inorganic anion transporter [Firmicutes bacterium]|nr:SulP family inorganic anion transporter [Bacillota bacterium]
MATYKKEYFKFDLVAALTVAVVALPQSMAYAIIAGVDPVYGLYSAIVLSVLGSMFGNSNHLATGPTNAISLLIASNMAVYVGKPNLIQMLMLLTFLAGAIQFMMGVLKLGKLVNYVSHSVIVGFTAGAGVIIALGQFNQLLGIAMPQGIHSTVEKVMVTFEHIGQTNYYALGLGLITIFISVTAKKINKNLPGALLGLIACGFLVAVFGLDRYGIKLTGAIPSAIPPFQMLSFDLQAMGALFNGAVVIAVIGLVEAVAISKAISTRSAQKLDSNQEFVGQGIANMGGSFFGAIAGSGSFTRSAINFQNGAVTRFSGVLAGGLVMGILLFMAPYAKYIPSAALAGVIMVVAYSMVDKNAFRKVFKSNKNDAAIMIITFATTILAPELEYAIYAGILISLLLYLKDNGDATVRMLSLSGKEGKKIIETNVQPKSNLPLGLPIAIIQLDGNLYFGNSSDLEEKLSLTRGDARVYILKFKGVSLLDITAMEVIENFIERAQHEGKKVLLCGIRPELKEKMQRCHLTKCVGENNIFLAGNEAYLSLQKSLQRAEALLKELTLPGPVAAVEAVPSALGASPSAAPPPPIAKVPRLKRLAGWMEKYLQEPFYLAETIKMQISTKS